MTTTKKTKTKPAADNKSTSDAAVMPAETGITQPEKSKSSLSAVLKEALAAKNKDLSQKKTDKKIDKGIKIGMPPRGTRKSMGKR